MGKPKLPFKKFEWTPELAYVVGLLVTDGNLSNDGRHIIMRSSDKDLLETFKECLSLQNKIGITWDNGKDKRPSFRVQFGNVQFYKWLQSIGLSPAKTYSIGPIKVPLIYFRDFLRGHLDGDGTILTYQDNYGRYKDHKYVNTRVYTHFISASEKHIRWLHKMVKKCSGISGALIYKRPLKINTVPMWQIKIAKYESLRFFEWLYYKKELPTLERKRAKADFLLNNIINGKLVRLTS